jgi:hypothetical protein
LVNLFKIAASAVARRRYRHQGGRRVGWSDWRRRAPGGDLDDACARAGLDKIKDQLK